MISSLTQTMNRTSNKDVEFQVEILNKLTNNPTEYWTDKKANIGNIHTRGEYGYTCIMQTVNEGGGVTDLARGLTKREAYQWLRAAITGISLQGGKK